ncbi:class I SAM-dependent RNA methyltransferase [Calditrichota bacterium]
MHNYNLKITDLADHRGVARTPEGQVVMIDHALPGDEVEVDIMPSPKPSNMLQGKLLNIINPSPHRIQHPCEHHLCAGESGYTGCKGSPLGAYDYDAQLDLKRKRLIETLSRIGGIKNADVRKVIPSPQPWAYRDRIELKLRRTGSGWQLNYGSETETAPILNCHLASTVIQSTLAQLNDNYAALNDVTTDDFPSARCLIRDNGSGKSVVILFIEQRLITGTLQQLSSWLQIESIAGNRILYAADLANRFNNHILLQETGDCDVRVSLGEHELKIDPLVFTQTNLSLRKQLCDLVLDEFTTDVKLTDFFGGFGWFGLAYAQRGGKSTIVESSRPAVLAGKRFSKEHQLSVDYILADLFKPLDRRLLPSCESLILDPPRSGLSKSLRKSLNQSGPETIVYVSCHMAALARDLQALSQYKPVHFTPVDMFPQTPELETVALLKRQVDA